MTDKDVIRSLECCNKENCLGCPFDNNQYCMHSLMTRSLDLIKRQQAEIEMLKSENKILSKNADTAFQDGLNEAQDLYAEQVKNEVRAKAIKEFADRLKGELNNLEYHENTDRKTVTKVQLYNFVNWIMRDVVPNEIDDLVKRIVGDSDD